MVIEVRLRQIKLSIVPEPLLLYITLQTKLFDPSNHITHNLFECLKDPVFTVLIGQAISSIRKQEIASHRIAST